MGVVVYKFGEVAGLENWAGAVMGLIEVFGVAGHEGAHELFDSARIVGLVDEKMEVVWHEGIGEELDLGVICGVEVAVRGKLRGFGEVAFEELEEGGFIFIRMEYRGFVIAAGINMVVGIGGVLLVDFIVHGEIVA